MEFRSRPVAGVTSEAKIKGKAAPGAVLDLEVALENCDTDAVLYDGQARTGGLPIVELIRSVGPMLPMEDFDDPDAVRERFQLLCGAETLPRGFSGKASLDPHIILTERDPGKRLRAEIRVPRSAPFFTDHFPRKPVLPATLLLDAQIELAVGLAAEAVDPTVRMLLRPTRVSNIKMRSFIPPGEALEIVVEVLAASRASAKIALAAEVGGQRVSTARLETGLWGTS
ncbi:MAG: 3-hydroxyacyl-ACP dehydratase FabZ family protein [Gemmatimonadales bacterium]